MPSETTAARPERTIVDVDSRGRLSLAKLGIKDVQLVAEKLTDGGIALHPAIVMTPSEARHYANPEAIELLNRGLAAAAKGEVEEYRLRSDR
jgi:hypothetical protein